MLRPRKWQVSINREEQQLTYRGLFPLCFWWLVGWDPRWTPDRPPWPARCSWLEAPVRCSCMRPCTLLVRTVVNPENWNNKNLELWFWISKSDKSTSSKVHRGLWRTSFEVLGQMLKNSFYQDSNQKHRPPNIQVPILHLGRKRIRGNFWNTLERGNIESNINYLSKNTFLGLNIKLKL